MSSGDVSFGDHVHYLSLSLFIGFGLKSILLDIKMATPSCLLIPFAWNSLTIFLI